MYTVAGCFCTTAGFAYTTLPFLYMVWVREYICIYIYGLGGLGYTALGFVYTVCEDGILVLKEVTVPTLHGHLADKKQPPTLGPPYDPWCSPTLGS